MSSPDVQLHEKTQIDLFQNYHEIPERRAESLIGGKRYQTSVLKHKDVDLGGFRRFFEGLGLFILTVGTLGFALISDRIRDSWQETIDGRSVKYIKTPISSIDRRMSSSSIPLLSRDSSPSSEVGSWMRKDASELPQKRQSVADAYWKLILNKSKKDHSMIIGFLKSIKGSPDNLEELFNESIQKEDLSLFRSLFDHLSTEDLQAINNGERLNVRLSPPFTDQPVKIDRHFLQDLKDFMRDTNFSGVVTISDGTSTHTISSSNISRSQAPFAMHSVGKVFTGVLILRLIEEGIIPEDVLDKPIQLNAEVIKALPPAVQEQLSKTTLRDVMVHRGRYGDYLGNYVNALEKALKEGTEVPQINHPRDFLAYADEELIPLDKLGPEGDSYSNLGILLAGLSIEHLYNEHSKENIPYDEILNRYVLEPSGVTTFHSKMPRGARFNKDDLSSPHIAGGPAGGYWTTAEDLLKFGKWLGIKSKDEQFMRLANTYGGEFYNNREFSHGGSIESASAHISHRIDNGLTVSVMSDMTGLGRASKLAEMIQQRLLEDNS